MNFHMAMKKYKDEDLLSRLESGSKHDFIKIVFSRYQNREISYCLFISCFTFFFPLKSTGSLYASYYGTFSFLLLAFAIFHFNNCIQKK